MVHQDSTVATHCLRDEDMIGSLCSRVNLNVRHLYGRTSDGCHPVEGIACCTGMVQRRKAAERRLQLRHHSEIGPETACGDDDRPSREPIAAAVGILHTDPCHATIYSRQQPRHLV